MEAPYNLIILILVNILFLQMLLKSSCITPTKLPKMLQQRYVNQSEVLRHVQMYQHSKIFQLKQNILCVFFTSSSHQSMKFKTNFLKMKGMDQRLDTL